MDGQMCVCVCALYGLSECVYACEEQRTCRSCRDVQNRGAFLDVRAYVRVLFCEIRFMIEVKNKLERQHSSSPPSIRHPSSRRGVCWSHLILALYTSPASHSSDRSLGAALCQLNYGSTPTQHREGATGLTVHVAAVCEGRGISGRA